jgi:hypothetical protein
MGSPASSNSRTAERLKRSRTHADMGMPDRSAHCLKADFSGCESLSSRYSCLGVPEWGRPGFPFMGINVPTTNVQVNAFLLTVPLLWVQ